MTPNQTGLTGFYAVNDGRHYCVVYARTASEAIEILKSRINDHLNDYDVSFIGETMPEFCCLSHNW